MGAYMTINKITLKASGVGMHPETPAFFILWLKDLPTRKSGKSPSLGA